MKKNIIHPPIQFRDRPIPAPRTKKQKPVAAKRTFISQTEKALKGYTKSYEIEVRDEMDPLKQLNITRRGVEYELKKQLEQLKGCKFVLTLKVTFEKIEQKDKTITKTAYFNSHPQIILNEKDIDLSQSNQEIVNKIAVWISEGSGWVIRSIDAEYVNIVKYEPLKGSSYLELPTFLKNSSKGLINLKNKDNKCFMWCHIRHLNQQAKDPQRIKIVDKNFVSNVDYTGIEFPVTSKQYNKSEKQNNINVNVFSLKKQDIFPIYVTKENYDNTMNLLLITEEEKQHYVLIKDFNKLMYKKTKHQHRKYFCMHCLQCFSSENVLNNQKTNCVAINGTQAIKMPEKGENILKFNNHHKQLPQSFVISADFEA